MIQLHDTVLHCIGVFLGCRYFSHFRHDNGYLYNIYLILIKTAIILNIAQHSEQAWLAWMNFSISYYQTET